MVYIHPQNYMPKELPMSSTILLTNLLTMDDVCIIFGVKQMTLWNWRKREFDPMPDIVIPGNERNNVRFDFDAIEAWGRKNEKKMPGLHKIRQKINARVGQSSEAKIAI